MLNVAIQSTYKRDGKVMVQTEIQENGMVVVYHREIKGDEMHVVSSDKSASLAYIRANASYKFLIDCNPVNRKSLAAT